MSDDPKITPHVLELTLMAAHTYADRLLELAGSVKDEDEGIAAVLELMARHTAKAALLLIEGVPLP